MLSSAGCSCSEEARQAQAQRAERQRRLQLEHEEQLAKERCGDSRCVLFGGRFD
jgi:hypothetical protein